LESHQNKTALILGANSDIASALAYVLSREGFRLILCSRNMDELKRQVLDLESRFEQRHEMFAYDASEPQATEKLLEKLPYIPELTICAFGSNLLDEKNASSTEKHQLLSINYVSAALALECMAIHYARVGSGGIIGISSVAGERGRQSNYLYGSAKAGFSAYLSGLRNSVFPLGIHVMSVYPGFVSTKMTRGLPLPKLLLAQPEEVAEEIFNSWKKKKNICYAPSYWRIIMWVIKCIPESVFKRLKL
jgi:short-subunit dehydrogenase